MATHSALAFISTWRTVFRLANTSTTVLVSVACGDCNHTTRTTRTHATHLDTLCLYGLVSTPLSLDSCLSRLMSLVCRVSLVSCLSFSTSALLLCSVCPVLFVSFLCLSVSLAWGQRHGQAQADTGPQALPDQQWSCPRLCVFRWVPNSTFSHSHVRAMAASALRRTGKSTQGGTSSPSRPPNLAPEHPQLQSASSLALP